MADDGTAAPGGRSSRGSRATSASGLPPGPRLPRRLQTTGFFERHRPFMERCQARYGETFTVRLVDGENLVLTSSLEAVEQIFKGDPDVFRAGEGNRPLQAHTGETSVFQLDGAEHLKLRKLMLPSFHGQRIQRYEQMMTELAAAEVASWPLGEPLRLWPRMEAVTLDVIMRAVFGVQEGERFERLRPLLARRRLKQADEILYDEIRRRRHAPDLADRDDIMSMLVEARSEDGDGLSDQQVRDQLVTLLLAGHETTATTLAWAIERLVRHPEALERLKEEASTGEESYLEAVVRETLRVRPVVDNVLRHLTAPAEVGGYLVPAGSNVTPSIYLVHRRADVYPEPDRFLPERFLDRAPGTYTWIPFGGGTRRCLGASFALFESRKLLKAIIARVRLRPVRTPGERAIRVVGTVRPEHYGEVVVDERRSA
jgi:cytochrome P450